jgi:HSP20 family protein
MAKRGTELEVSRGNLERMPRPRSPFGEIDRLFDDFFGRRFGWYPLGERGEFGPNVDIIDRDDEVVVRAEVPGFKKDEIDVSASGSTLTLSGTAAAEQREEKGNYYRYEISRRSFSRTLDLPAEVDDSKAKASLKDGLLELTLPKLEKSRRRSITIS